MSFVRKLSFKKQTLKSEKVLSDQDVAKQNGEIRSNFQVAISEYDESLAMTERSDLVLSQVAENNEDRNNQIVGFSRRNGNGTVEIIEPSTTDIIGTDLEGTDSTATQPNKNKSSFAFPDGLAMDPMAPTALAVSSEFMERIGSGLTLLRDHGKKIQKYVSKNTSFEVLKKSWKSIVNIDLIDAKDLPDYPATGSNTLYCKFRLGTESHKSKQVSKLKANWRERFSLHLYDDSNLEITVWHKGKNKNFMGRCSIDLSKLEKEKTHDLWQELECGYGSIHLLVTLSATGRSMIVDNVPTTNGVNHVSLPSDDFSWYNLDNLHEVGHLTMTVFSARGLCSTSISGKCAAYCVLELDNSRVQTHTVKASSEPTWNKSYSFTINDITSTLDITVYNESIINSAMNEKIGSLSIPLLRINNNEKRWYALKDRSKKGSARGNCPRILLQMSVNWNPIKASLRVLNPKETKYIKKRQKFNIPLIYSNLKFIKDIFDAVVVGNNYVIQVFEWDNREKSTVALMLWLVFWYFIQLWMVPLILCLPFVYNWSEYKSCNNVSIVPVYTPDDDIPEEDVDNRQDLAVVIRNRIYGLQDLTFSIKNGVDYIVSLVERLHNLTTFAVPYLSYLVVSVLMLASVVLYFIPVRYLFMALGIYKFTRKVMNPSRVPNNDILDFLSRVPDNEILKQWQELKVPEPQLNANQ